MSFLSTVRALSFCCAFSLSLPAAQTTVPSVIRLIDLNGDGRRDMIENRADGSLTVLLGLGDRQFETILQELPRLKLVNLVSGDFNSDGNLDLYLITGQANVALIGDGTGLFQEATELFGLVDYGVGLGAEFEDLDGDGASDLLLRNRTGDVLFWGDGVQFERDTRTPLTPASISGGTIMGEPRLGGRDSEGFDLPGAIQGEQSVTQRPFDSAGRSPVLSNLDDSGANSPTPVPAVIGPIAPPLTTGSVRGLPKLQVGLTLQEKQILALLSIVDLPDGLGGTAQTLRVSGANLQVVNGLGVTNSLNALGNLIVGYNEFGNPAGDNRTGSHNIVGGNENNFTGVGGHIVGEENAISSTWASVSGGRLNTASGISSSVSGGMFNRAPGSALRSAAECSIELLDLALRSAAERTT